jgi:hypothetical protein
MEGMLDVKNRPVKFCLRCGQSYRAKSRFQRLCRPCQRFNGRLGAVVDRFKRFPVSRQKPVLEW